MDITAYLNRSAYNRNTKASPFQLCEHRQAPVRVRHVLAAVSPAMPANVRLCPDSDRSAGRLDDASTMLNDFGIDELF
jgi:hypothetical protein